MQRVRNLARKKEAGLVCTPGGLPPGKLELDNNTIFLLSFHDRRIADLVGIRHAPQKHDMALYETSTRGRCYECNTPLIFQYNLRLYINLRQIEIVSSKKVYMRSFNSMRIDSVTLSSVGSIDTEGAEGIRIGVLALKGLCIGLQTFISLVRVARPFGLMLEDVKCPDMLHSDFWQVFRVLTSLKIISLDVFNSFVDFGLFRRIVSTLGMRHFSYAGGGPVSLFKARTPYMNTCLVDRRYALADVQGLGLAESLHISNQDSTDCLLCPMRLLRCLRMDGVTIDDGLIRALGPIRKVSLSNCAFKAVSFYDFVRRVSKTLRYISLHKTEIPLDGFFFMRKALSRCQVVVPGVTSFYIEGGAG